MDANAALWHSWLEETLLRDIADPDTDDPVPLFETTADGLQTSDALGSYKWGKNDGEYLYLLYQLTGDGTDPTDVIPVYVGESSDISTRIGQHSRKIRSSLPLSSWTDDDSWGSFSKYDHIAAIHERSERPLYAWIHDLDEDTHGPYGNPTYRQELEAKLVGLIHGQDRFDRVFANREFVPNSVLQAIGQAGPAWVTELDTEQSSPETNDELAHKPTVAKAQRWRDWVDQYLLADLQSDDVADPIPLFETDASRQVALTDNQRLKRSARIDERIRQEGQRCVDADGLRDDGYDGLLYVMYQLEAPAEEATPADIVPRYIGKAEASGKKRDVSANFEEIAYERNSTRSFARWGDGDYWHVGELSMALLGDDDRKSHWVDALFEPESRRLRRPTYLWIRAWNPTEDIGPYDLSTTLAAVEPLLIGVAHAAAPETLLNKDGVPSTDGSE
ncbi:GIY-YIG nuclease family protein [Haloarcula salina]|uniref:GIY-YIG nuclease family protein n=1 Tax=Haloarcula salina TaxID=1429914 RepID=A0AA41KJ43_9EURY|nr:GIY-YIG nuclease family protein [Haloarcula salina]MBV0903491.1 GIY-YIG nuclease family protein [Haloarcula salina]